MFGMADVANKNQTPTRLLWIDLEMTGLDPELHRIVEVAAIVTDFSLSEIDQCTAIIHQPDSVLAASNDFCIRAHENSGLYASVRKSTLDEHDVEAELCQLIERNFPGERAILAGNSIHVDRRFIDAQWPRLAALLHYRMLDVSSLKIWRMGTGQAIYTKKETHRALDDIRESIAELHMYTG